MKRVVLFVLASAALAAAEEKAVNFVPAKAGRYGMLRIAQIDQRNRKLRVGQFLIGKLRKRGARCIVD